MQRFSLIWTVKHVLSVDQRYFDRAAEVLNKFRTRTLPHNVLLPGLQRFPIPVQTLLTPKIQEGKRMCEDGDLIMPGLLVDVDIDTDNSSNFFWSEAQCECRFYRKWRLPCGHLFHHHFVNEGQTLTEARLMQWSDLWESTVSNCMRSMSLSLYQIRH